MDELRIRTGEGWPVGGALLAAAHEGRATRVLLDGQEIAVIVPPGQYRGPVVTLVRAVQTCYACPSQWDAWDDTGRYWYLRYRHGYGEACPDDAGSDAAFTFTHGHPLDGCIELDEFCRLAGIKLDLS